MIVVNIKGGLGNQLFQYAAGKALANHYSTDLQLDISWFKPPTRSNRIYQLSNFAIEESICKKDSSVSHFTEPNENFYTDFFSLSDGVHLDGYWQSEKYFSNIEDIIRKQFALKSPPQGKNQEILQRIMSSNSSCCVHVRRGDNVSNPDSVRIHGCPKTDYYVDAMKKMMEWIPNAHFYVFSDDIKWCRQNLPRFGHEFVFVDHNNEHAAHEDLRLMAACKHHITANSSLSWWAAWLGKNPSQRVIIPDSWYAVERSTVDLFPSNWSKVSHAGKNKQSVPSISTSSNPKISIVMAYFNRLPHLAKTLESISFSSVRDRCEIIIVDDGSESKHDPNSVTKFGLNVKVITIPDGERKWKNPCVPFNRGFDAATGDIVVIQSPECFHVGDILSSASSMKCNEYLSYSVLNLIESTHVKKFEKMTAKAIYNQANRIFNVDNVSDDVTKNHWYNHPFYRPRGYHFISAIWRKHLVDINGFDERYANGHAWDDDDLIERIKRYGLDITCVPPQTVFGIHQYHANTTRSKRPISKECLQANKKVYEEITLQSEDYVARRLF